MARKKVSPPADPPQTINVVADKKPEAFAGKVLQLAEFAASALFAAEELGICSKPLEHFTLSPAQREVLLAVPEISKSIKTKLAKDQASFTVAEVARMAMALGEATIEDEPRKQRAIEQVAQHLTQRLRTGIEGLGEAKLMKTQKPQTQVDAKTVYQFKITLIGIQPPIWRRIQLQDCTLDEFHELLQSVMGWTNSHLHQFDIQGKQYGDPDLLADGFEECEYVDSTNILLSSLLPQTRKPFVFKYEYDFGDGWEHAVLYEGSLAVDPKAKYPLCLEGERACPPEDCGGVWGYVEFLEAIKNKKHPQHEEMLQWVGGRFDSEAFDPKQATKKMKQ